MSFGGEAVYFNRVRQEILPLLPATPGRYLEIGCGAGATLAHIRTLGLATWAGGVEFSPEAAKRAGEKGFDLLLQGDVETMALPLEPGSLDVILCLDVLEHLRDPWAMAARLAGLLKPGGVLVVSLPNIRHYKIVLALLFRGQWRYQDAGILDRTHLRFFVRESAVELLHEAGLAVEAVQPQGLKRWKLKWILNRLLLGSLTDLFAEQFLLRGRKGS